MILTKNCWNVLRKRIAQKKKNPILQSKVIKKKSDKLYVKLKGYDNYFHN